MEPPGRDKHEMSLLEAASAVPRTLISGIGNNQDLVCRVHRSCQFGPELDSEFGNLIRPNPNALFTYTRYDHEFTRDELNEARTISKQGITLDNLDLIPFLLEIGDRYAQKNVQLSQCARGQGSPRAPTQGTGYEFSPLISQISLMKFDLVNPEADPVFEVIPVREEKNLCPSVKSAVNLFVSNTGSSLVSGP